MADGVPPPPGSPLGDADLDRQPEETAPRPAGDDPPSLSSIRVRGPGAKGLNKPAILVTAGGGLVAILVLASGALSSGPSRPSAESRPMMSAPARPETARGALQSLPATYGEAQVPPPGGGSADVPLLGPPLPGDIAAFAPQSLEEGAPVAPQDDWGDSGSWSAGPPADPALDETREAARSGLFFALREPSQTAAAAPTPALRPAAPRPALAPAPNPLTALAAEAGADNGGHAAAREHALFPGTVIPASLVTAIHSESPGPVIAQVTQTIYDSGAGRIALIPQGARLLGEYASNTRYGQSRVAVVWSRLIMPDGEEIVLDAAALDPGGAAGVAGKVDNHWGEVFGAAALGTLINVGAAATEDPELSYGGVGVMPRNPVDGALAEGVQRGAAIVTNRVVDRSLAIPPTIRVDAGKRITVIVTRRMVMGPADT